jgi:acid phosphatase type 7
MTAIAQDAPRTRVAVRIAFVVAVLAALAAWSAAPAHAADPVIAAAGDIACSPNSQYYNGGAGTSIRCRQRYTSNLLVNANLSAVLALGDEQYDAGSLSAFTKSYDPTWGRVKPFTFPAIGNHEYGTSAAKGYFDYFNGAGAFSGPAGDRDKGYYSFDIGSWHLIALNSSDHCRVVSCAKGSAQENWLRADLAAHPAACTLAYWHHPRFNSGHDGNASFMQAIFQDLYDADADVVLGGHAHDYERFGPQDPKGKLDRARGIRQFVVGTGGAFPTPFGTRQPNSEVRQGTTYGVLMLALHPNAYDWRFVPEAGKSFTDSGSGSCHGPGAPAAAASAPAVAPTASYATGARLQSSPQRSLASALARRTAPCTIVGTAGNDVLVGTPGDDVICGLAGNDRIRGRDGDDQLFGGRGRDSLFGGRGNDVLHGNFANDLLHGHSGNDLVSGEGGRNRIYGDSGDDVLIASLNGRGVDRVYGGRGRDRAELNHGDRVRSALPTRRAP